MAQITVTNGILSNLVNSIATTSKDVSQIPCIYFVMSCTDNTRATHVLSS